MDVSDGQRPSEPSLDLLAKQRFLEGITAAKLRHILQRGGLKTSGLKEDLVRRAIECFSSEQILQHTLDEDLVPYAEGCGIKASEGDIRARVLQRWNALAHHHNSNNNADVMIADDIIANRGGVGCLADGGTANESPSSLGLIDRDVVRQRVSSEFFRRMNDLSQRLSESRSLTIGDPSHLPSLMAHTDEGMVSSAIMAAPGGDQQEFSRINYNSNSEGYNLFAPLLWPNCELKLLIQRAEKVFHDVGKEGVCDRLSMLCCENVRFEPNIAGTCASLDGSGGLRVECQGVYFRHGQPIGPFMIQFYLVKEPLSANAWCIRLIQWIMK